MPARDHKAGRGNGCADHHDGAPRNLRSRLPLRSVDCHDEFSEAFSYGPSSDTEWHLASAAQQLQHHAGLGAHAGSSAAASAHGYGHHASAAAAAGEHDGAAGAAPLAQLYSAATGQGPSAAGPRVTASSSAPGASRTASSTGVGAQLGPASLALPGGGPLHGAPALASHALTSPTGGTAAQPSPSGPGLPAKGAAAAAAAAALPAALPAAPWDAAGTAAAAAPSSGTEGGQLEHHALSNLNRSLQACPVALALGGSTGGLLGSLGAAPLAAAAAAGFNEDCFDVEDPYSEEQRDEDEHQRLLAQQQQQQQQVGRGALAAGRAAGALPPLPPGALPPPPPPLAGAPGGAAQGQAHGTWGSSDGGPGWASAQQRLLFDPLHVLGGGAGGNAPALAAPAQPRRLAGNIIDDDDDDDDGGPSGSGHAHARGGAGAGGGVYGSPLYNRPLDRVRDAASGLPSHISAFGEGYSGGSAAATPPPGAGAAAAGSLKLPSHISAFGEGSADLLLPPGHHLHPHMIMTRLAASALGGGGGGSAGAQLQQQDAPPFAGDGADAQQQHEGGADAATQQQDPTGVRC